jgi:hypothetical protein
MGREKDEKSLLNGCKVSFCSHGKVSETEAMVAHYECN